MSFTGDEVARWLDPLTIDVLAPLVQTLPATASVALPAMTPLYRPIFRSGDHYVVAAPHYLLPAFVRALLEQARERDQLESVASRFRDAVYGNVLQSALYLGWDEIEVALPGPQRASRRTSRSSLSIVASWLTASSSRTISTDSMATPTRLGTRRRLRPPSRSG